MNCKFRASFLCNLLEFTSIISRKCILFALLLIFSITIYSQTAKLEVQVIGIEMGDSIVLTLANNKYIFTQKITSNKRVSFLNVPNGDFFLKAEALGYELPKAQKISIIEPAEINPKNLSLEVVKIKNVNSLFYHSWQEDASYSGYTKTAYVNQDIKIEFLGKEVTPINVASADMLLFAYNIILDNQQLDWTQEYAYRLLETMKKIPQQVRKTYQDSKPVISKWVLTDESIFNDIEVIYTSEGNTVRISKDVFVYATPQIVNFDGVRGSFFSNRLNSSLVKYVTHFGVVESAVERILNESYGCSIRIPNYVTLTKGTTDEDQYRFQKFTPNELIYIISMFEEMPDGFHVIPQLKYLIRRKNGLDHPLYNAPAVAWTTNGYIEFMEKAFTSDIEYIFRLILHEKTHFLWSNVFSESLKNEWIKLGGWYVNANDPDGWSTTLQTEFVSDYAHKKNPNEDMAESVSYYIKNPNALRSRSLKKYEFIRDRIMHGIQYISKIPDNLTFEVLNLFPDYDYPGKIKRLDIKVEGAPEADKVITVEIELNHVNKFFDGAKNAITRITSEAGTFIDLWLTPIDKEGYVLRGKVTLSKFAKNGFWQADQIKINDKVGNQRFEGVDDYVWRMYINNPLEDIIKPKYVPNTLNYLLSNIQSEGRVVQQLTVKFEVNENKKMRTSGPVMIRLTNKMQTNQYSFSDTYGVFDESTKTGIVKFNFTEFMPSGEYYVSHISLNDQAENYSTVYFSASPSDEPIKTIKVTTANPDTIAPEIDINRISVYAEPTNPQAPDGETKVKITYFARDDKSGLGKVNYQLLDPQGISHFEYHYHENYYTNYFVGDPTVWKKYEINIILPRGSAPGIWGLQSMEIKDKAQNVRKYNFVETIRFDPYEKSDFHLAFTDDKINIANKSQFIIQVTSDLTNYKYNYKVIHEDTGIAIEDSTSGSTSKLVDLKNIPDGWIIFSVVIFDNNGKTLAIRNKRIFKDTEAPTIQLRGASTLSVKFGSVYEDPGVITFDNLCKKIGVQISGEVNVNKTGTYKLSYTALDSVGNSSISIERTINVLEQSILTVSANTLTFMAVDNNTKTFDINSNIDWIAESNQTWLNLSRTSGSNNATIILTAQTNSSTANRTAIISVSGIGLTTQTVQITQEAGIAGIGDANENSLLIFPNPVKNELTINNISFNTTISIFDLMGRLLFNKVSNSSIEKIDISNFANGVYTIRVLSNNVIKSDKFIKQ